MTELKLGTQGPEVFRFYDYFKVWAKNYAFLLGNRDGYYGSDEARFTDELQRRLGIPRTGRFGDLEANRTGYRWTGTTVPPAPPQRRKIWLYSSPGSGANFDQGPSNLLGHRCEDELHINHQPLYFQKGGYLGFMGGDPKFSYNEVIFDQYKSFEYCLDNNPDAQEAMAVARAYIGQKGWREDDLTDSQLIDVAAHLEFETHVSGYSQSADGFEDALEILFGDGGFVHAGDKTHTINGPGKYRLIRHCLKLVVQFGNPSTKNTGIARKKRPAWLDKKIRNVNYANDFYAIAPDEIRPAMYGIIIQAEMEMPFFIHVMKIALKVMEPIIPVFGGLLGPFGAVAIAAVAGLNSFMPLLGGVLGQTASAADEEVDRKLYEMFSLTGLSQNVGGIIGLVGALPGLQAHGSYEFDQNMMNQAYNHIASFRR